MEQLSALNVSNLWFCWLQIVREHYLRDDIGCGSEACKKCTILEDGQEPLLDAKPPSALSKAYSNPHYLIVDTNVVLHQVCTEVIPLCAKLIRFFKETNPSGRFRKI